MESKRIFDIEDTCYTIRRQLVQADFGVDIIDNELFKFGIEAERASYAVGMIYDCLKRATTTLDEVEQSLANIRGELFREEMGIELVDEVKKPAPKKRGRPAAKKRGRPAKKQA